MFKTKELAKAVRFALLGGAVATAMTSLPVLAAEGEEEVERIEVTGSRIKRTDIETSSPVSVFTAEDLAKSGFTTTEDFVQNIPAFNGGSLGSSINNGSDGYATAALRGLGDGRTLILIDGRRVVSNDLNMIPMSLIERVEVVRDGASTTYGSDAIAGVINFITKKDFEGAAFNTQYDVTGEGDGKIYALDGTVGAASDKGNVVMNVSFTRREEIWQADRDYTECAIGERGGEKVCIGSGTTYPGRAITSNGPFIYDESIGDYVPYNAAVHSFNYAAYSYLQTPQDVFSLNAAGNHELAETDFTTINTFAQLGMTNRQSDQLMAAEGTFWGQAVPETNPGNVWGEEVYVARRMQETGGREFTQDAQTWRFVAGFDGELKNGWGWDVAYSQAHFTDTQVEYGRANPKRVGILVDPDACADNADCPGVWNPFREGTLTQEMIDYAFLPNSPVIESNLRDFLVNLNGDTGGFELPGGPIGWAVGYENRYEDYLSQPDGGAILGEIFAVTAEKTDGSTRANEAFLELNAPLLSGVTAAERLTLIAAVRYTDYNFLDDAEFNKKFGIEWEPLAGLLIRGTYADGFRAPSITELYDPQAQSAQQYTDPCINWGSNPDATDALRANCAADGLPSDFDLDSDQSQSLFSGNAELEPEKSDSLTIGFVYTPEFVDDLSVGIDYYNIEITDAIGNPGTDNVIRECYASESFSSPMCALILGPDAVKFSPSPTGSPRRDVLQNVVGIDLTNDNLASFETSGIDFDISYLIGQVGPGELKLSMNGSYLMDYTYVTYEGGPSVEAAGKIAEDQWTGNPAAYNEWRTNLAADYAWGDFGFNWTARYQSAVDLLQPNETYLDNSAEAMLYHDIQGTYTFDRYDFALGVRNLLDEEPPYVTEYDDMNTIPASYDTAGRYFYVRAGVKF